MTDTPQDGQTRSGGRIFLAAAGALVAALFIVVAVRFVTDAGPQQRGGRPPTPVVTAEVAEREFVELVEAIGTVRANESVTVTATVTEIVRGLSFDSGQVVDAGEILAELTSGQEAAELTDARARLQEAERQYARIRDLVRKGAASGARLDETLSARDQAKAQVAAIEARLDDRLVRAPFAGVVGLRLVSPGALVQPGDEIATLDDVSSVKIDFSVPEVALASLRVGMPVRAETDAYPGEVFAGEVVSIDSRVDPVTRAIQVRSDLPNSDGRLRPGMLMSVELIKRSRTAPAVPELAVVVDGEAAFVFAAAEAQPSAQGPGGSAPGGVRSGGRDALGGAGGPGLQASQRRIAQGQRRAGYVEIVSGLELGEVIVVEGVHLLRDGAPIRIVDGPAGDGDRPASAGAAGQT